MITLAGTESQPHARAVLATALSEREGPSHAYLFCGPAGSGKNETARALAAELLADGASDPEVTRQRVARGVHPDLTWVVPSGAHELLVSDIDQPVVTAATRTPFEARRRVFVIEAAETMNEEAANRLLKTLEEPAEFVHLILLTDRPSELLPTVASRCQRVRFDALPANEIARQLIAEGVGDREANACARLALGDVERARELALGDEGSALRSRPAQLVEFALSDFDEDGEESRLAEDRPWLSFLELAKARGDYAVNALDQELQGELDLLARSQRAPAKQAHEQRTRRARRRAETATIDLSIQLVVLWLRDLMCLAGGADDLLFNGDRVDQLRSQWEILRRRDMAPTTLHEAVAAAEVTRQSLRLSVGSELALEALAYRLQRLLA